MLSSWGVSFKGVDVEAEPALLEDLLRLRIPGVPATVIGDRVVHGWNPRALAELVGVTYVEGERLSPEQLAQRLDAILAANQRLLRQIPLDRMGLKGPGRDRTARDLGYHIFRLSAAFVDCREQGHFPETWFHEKAPAGMVDGEAIARHGQGVRERLAAWFARPGWCDGVVHTYYGSHHAHDLMERTTWHAAQHLRQMYWFLDQMGIVPDGRLTDEDLRGLPFPREVWS